MQVQLYQRYKSVPFQPVELCTKLSKILFTDTIQQNEKKNLSIPACGMVKSDGYLRSCGSHGSDKKVEENGNMPYGKKIVSRNLHIGLLGVFGEILHTYNYKMAKG